MVYKPLGLKDFLGHNPGMGGRTKFLKKWKTRRPPEIDVWLHTRAPWSPLWQHSLPRVRTIEDKMTKERKRVIWGSDFNCLENENVVSLQYKTEREDPRQRVAPPEMCPVCLLLDYFRVQLIDGAISIVQPLFDFWLEEDSSQRRILYAGSFVGGFKSGPAKFENLSPEAKQAVKDAGIVLGGDAGAWRDDGYAGLQYVFSVLDNENLIDGVQVTTETSLLGDKVKDAITAKCEQEGEEAGNPLLHPYAIRWKYNASEAQFQKKYTAIAMPTHGPNGIPYTDEIHRLIVEEDPPDLEFVCRPGDARELRAQLEQYAQVDIPWDDIFGPAEQAQAKSEDQPQAFPYGANEPEPEPEQAPPPVTTRARVQVPVTAPVRAPARPGPQAPPTTRQPPPVRAPAPAPQRPVAPAQTRAAPPPPQQRAPAAPPPRQAPPARQPPPPPPVARPGVRTKAEPPPPPAPLVDPAADKIPCDECQYPMLPDETVCTNCGTKYNITPDTSTAPQVPIQAAPPPIHSEPVVTGGDDDEIPFIHNVSDEVGERWWTRKFAGRAIE